MATDLTGLTMKLDLLLHAEAAKTADFATVKAPVTMAKVMEFPFGADVGSHNQIWWDRRTLAASADDELDLTGDEAGEQLLNAFGVKVYFDSVRLVIVINRSDETIGAHAASDAIISVGPGDGNDWLGPFQANTHRLNVLPGCPLILLSPADIQTVSADDDVKITNEDGAAEALYDILIAGVSE